ncbi:acyl-CoA dehydrogenase family protein [Aquisalimonas lutea]|uniref:acyl-CoA dehydrogenase family protein n=1 Tax=Aquisalimonas lutea TaxID=1327750 RepID=UPI0025B465AC|nr:acyl-CoA dehydrogenase family protein [Aquisalimonas lutea]MDN3516543.1 acyl-CoA dehydrogenase family protein [Aquisalimonas lutea]
MEDRQDEHRMLADSVRDFVRADATLSRVRALRETHQSFSREAWSRLADVGWLGIRVPEAAGGLDLGVAELAIVAEGLGRGRLPEPFVEVAGFAAAVIRSGDNDVLARDLLADIASGRRLYAVAWQEDSQDASPARPLCTVQPGGAGPVLTGRKILVTPAEADAYIVSAASADGIALYRVAADAPGLDVSAQALVDGSRVAELRLHGVPVPDGDRLASPGRGLEALEHGVAEAQVLASAEMLGLSEQLLALTNDYLATRRQFDRPLSAFQVLRHRAVNLYIQVELMRAALRQAVRVLDGDDDLAVRQQAASRAKARAGSAAMAVAREAVQLHGAIGYTEEADVGVHLHRIVALSAWLGNAAWHRRRYAALLPRESLEAVS